MPAYISAGNEVIMVPADSRRTHKHIPERHEAAYLNTDTSKQMSVIYMDNH